MQIRYKCPQHYALAIDVWPAFIDHVAWNRQAYCIAWFMRDVLLPAYCPHFGDPA